MSEHFHRECPCRRCRLTVHMSDQSAAALSRLPPAEAKRWRRDLLADRGSFTRTAEGGLIVLLHGKVMAHAGPELVRAAFGPEGMAGAPRLVPVS